MEKLNLQPKMLFEYFAQICEIPHGSKNEEKISLFLQEFGKNLGLETVADAAGNVLIKKPATPGYENRKTIILQSHMDMVCDKRADVEHDFKTDPIKTYVDGEWLKGTGLVFSFLQISIATGAIISTVATLSTKAEMIPANKLSATAAH